eukprot:CAMPEP_0172760212 /NCGR_PEP_ID=MMETSP1074-20121228/169168_1 /TAXON_ID=2916 /ORGANISM="Ceratium fusus, Strain PA161109" /LENGTH=98 /DNA_ID=CAMNT_0013594143 /DNA_START=229 /DNA_END=522 /DNA_ORIENTATION=+
MKIGGNAGGVCRASSLRRAAASSHKYEERANTAPTDFGCRSANCNAMPPPIENPPTAILSACTPVALMSDIKRIRRSTESSTLAVSSGELGGSPVRSN